LISGAFMLVALWLYFLNKKLAASIVAGVSLILSQLWFYLFFSKN